MTNHYHLLVQTPNSNISRAMRHLNGIYTQRFNKRHGFEGSVFKGRYKAILVESDSYVLELVRYIHRNPLETGLVDGLNKFTWSSHKGYLSNAEKWKWLHKDFILKLFSRSKDKSLKLYKQFVSKKTLEEINEIFGRKNLPSVLGSKSFIDKIKKKFFNIKDFEDIPESESPSPDVGLIKEMICKSYKIQEAELFILSFPDFWEVPVVKGYYAYLHRRRDLGQN